MMRYVITFLFSFFLLSAGSLQAKDQNPNDLPKTEAALLNKILNCLQYEDSITYATLFPDFDTLWKQVNQYRDTGVGIAEEMTHIKAHPEKVAQFDPYYNHSIVPNFYAVVKKGENLGIHWNNIVLLRYEFVKEKLTRDLLGYEHIAPFRFQGYVFIKDELTRRIFCFTVSEMQQIKGYWYGGQVLNIFEATTIEEYAAKLAEETRIRDLMKKSGLSEEEVMTELNKKNEVKDDTDKDDDEEEKVNNSAIGLIKKEVVDRKIYTGTFDNEIPITLYVRFLKGTCPSGICAWEGIYKFGDQTEYIKLDISKNSDGDWVFTEDPPLGNMVLTLKNKVFTGSWASTDNQTGYDVRLTETTLPTQKLVSLDEIMEKRQWAKGISSPVKEDTHGDIQVDESFEKGGE